MPNQFGIGNQVASVSASRPSAIRSNPMCIADTAKVSPVDLEGIRNRSDVATGRVGRSPALALRRDPRARIGPVNRSAIPSRGQRPLSRRRRQRCRTDPRRLAVGPRREGGNGDRAGGMTGKEPGDEIKPGRIQQQHDGRPRRTRHFPVQVPRERPDLVPQFGCT